VGIEFKGRSLYVRVSRRVFFSLFLDKSGREVIKIEFHTANGRDENFFTFVSYQKKSLFSPYKVSEVVDQKLTSRNAIQFLLIRSSD